MTHQCNKENDIEEIKKDVKSILKHMNGNGKVGMCAKVELMWKRMGFLTISVAGVILSLIGRMIFEHINK